MKPITNQSLEVIPSTDISPMITGESNDSVTDKLRSAARLGWTTLFNGLALSGLRFGNPYAENYLLAKYEQQSSENVVAEE